MKSLVSALAAAALAAGVAGAPALAVTSTGATSGVTFNTAFAPQYFGGGEYDGVLHLTFGPHGEVNGWYRSVDVGLPRPVVGGLTGNKLWLNLGGGGLHDLETTYENGKITGGTYLGNQVYTFTATPVKAQRL